MINKILDKVETALDNRLKNKLSKRKFGVKYEKLSNVEKIVILKQIVNHTTYVF